MQATQLGQIPRQEEHPPRAVNFEPLRRWRDLLLCQLAHHADEVALAFKTDAR